MKGIDHLVLAAPRLDGLRADYAALGFTLCPPGRHPFGTHNTLIQLKGRSYLELLSVGEPELVPEHAPGSFSFAAFNRDFISAAGQGFAMLVLDSSDGRDDAAAYRAAGISLAGPFDFSRTARLPDGSEATVAFSLAFTTDPRLPRAGFFACQHHAPQYFWNAAYQTHANGAEAVTEAALVANDPESLTVFLTPFTRGAAASPRAGGGIIFPLARGAIAVLTPEQFRTEYGVAAPDLSAGPRLAGYTVTVADLAAMERGGFLSGAVPGRGRLTRMTCGAAVAFAGVTV